MTLFTKIGLASVAAILVCANAQAQQFTIETGKTKPLRLNANAASVIIGNPNVADVAVQNGKLLFVSGKTFGTTNLMVFDSEGNTIYSANVVVTTNTANLVSVNRGGQNYTYDCAPTCRPGLSVGDEPEFYDQVYGQIEQQKDLSE